MNKRLNNAKSARNDEFYTLIEEVASEMDSYLAIDPDLFRGKTILLPCDAEWSAFTQYFAVEGERLGVKKVINSTADFRSPEVKALRDEADFIITNPPFSLMREFMEWVIESGKKFAFVVPLTVLSCQYAWIPLKDRLLWWGSRRVRPIMEFRTPTGELKQPGQCAWLTNLPHNNPPQPIPLLPTEVILRDNRHMRGLTGFQRYLNCDAINIPAISCIPSDYDGLMGVPVTIFTRHCPDQFELVGFRRGDDGEYLRVGPKAMFARILIRRKA